MFFLNLVTQLPKCMAAHSSRPLSKDSLISGPCISQIDLMHQDCVTVFKTCIKLQEKLGKTV